MSAPCAWCAHSGSKELVGNARDDRVLVVRRSSRGGGAVLRVGVQNATLGGITRYGAAEAKVGGKLEGSVLTVAFQLDGQDFVALNGGPQFSFTPAISFMAYC